MAATIAKIIVCDGDETGQELLNESLRVMTGELLGVTLQFEHFDLSLERRRSTKNEVVREAAAAMVETGLGLKAATITPPEMGGVGSPNRLLREGIGGSVIVESVFAWPGFGLLAFEALLTRDIDGSGFQPRPGLVVLKPDDTFVKPGSNEIGVIATAGRLPKGYLNDPAKTAEVFRVIDGTRYLVIGDEAMIESDGRIKILGRGTSCINTGGEKVWPEEIEVTIRDHPEVADAAVFGMPDEKWGQKVTAVVTVRDSAKVSDEQLHAHCRGRLAGYKCPKQWIRIPHVPRTYVGKPDYKAIHQILDEMAVASQYPANDSMRS